MGKRKTIQAGIGTLSLAELQMLLGLERSAVYRMADANTLPVATFRAGRRRYVSRQAVEALLGAEVVAQVVAARGRTREGAPDGRVAV